MGQAHPLLRCCPRNPWRRDDASYQQPCDSQHSFPDRLRPGCDGGEGGLWYPGPEGGTALAQILFGDISPSGKLPVTFYESSDRLPDFTDYSMKNRTYRYAENNVLFPFGYGLTYGKIVCTSVEYKGGKAVVAIENTGGKTADDVIQLYIRDYCENAVPNVSLCGFKRVNLAAGEKMIVEIPVSERAFTAVDENGERGRFGSRFTLYAGTHQPDEISEKLCGTKCVSTEIQL